MKVHIHQQLLKLFQTPLSRSSSFYLKITMSVPCPFVLKKKTSRLEVVQLKLTTCTSPKDISLWLCKSLPPSGRTQRKSTKITSDFCRQCLLLQMVSGVFFKLNNSRKSWYKIPMKSPPSKIHLPFFHDLNKVPAASRILIYSCWHYVGKKGEFNACSWRPTVLRPWYEVCFFRFLLCWCYANDGCHGLGWGWW